MSVSKCLPYEVPQTGGLNGRNLLSHSLETRSLRSMCSFWGFRGEPLPSSLLASSDCGQSFTFLGCRHITPIFAFMLTQAFSLCVQASPLYQNTRHRSSSEEIPRFWPYFLMRSFCGVGVRTSVCESGRTWKLTTPVGQVKKRGGEDFFLRKWGQHVKVSCWKEAWLTEGQSWEPVQWGGPRTC